MTWRTRHLPSPTLSNDLECEAMHTLMLPRHAGKSMSYKRFTTAAAALGGCNYVADYTIPVSFAILIDTSHLCRAGKSMSHKRFTTAAAELGGCIYVAGGYDNQRYLASVERFDPREGRWCEVPPMAHKRGAHTCTAANGCAVAIGGWDGAK